MLTPIEAVKLFEYAEKASKDGQGAGKASQFRALLGGVNYTLSGAPDLNLETYFQDIVVEAPEYNANTNTKDPDATKEPLKLDDRDSPEQNEIEKLERFESPESKVAPSENAVEVPATGPVAEHQGPPDAHSQQLIRNEAEATEIALVVQQLVQTQTDYVEPIAEVPQESAAQDAQAPSLLMQSEVESLPETVLTSEFGQETDDRTFQALEDESPISDPSAFEVPQESTKLASLVAEVANAEEVVTGVHRRESEKFQWFSAEEAPLALQSTPIDATDVSGSPDFIQLSALLQSASKGAVGSKSIKAAAFLSEALGGVQSAGRSEAAGGGMSPLGVMGPNSKNSEPAQGDSKKVTVPQKLVPRLLEKIEEVVKDVERSRDGKTISLRLDPPQLGRVRIHLNVVDGSIHARFSAENPAVLQMLRERADDLQSLIRRVGQDLDQATVSFGGEGFSQQSKNGGFFEKGGDTSSFIWSRADVAAGRDRADGEQSSATQMLRGAGGVELNHWVA